MGSCRGAVGVVWGEGMGVVWGPVVVLWVWSEVTYACAGSRKRFLAVWGSCMCVCLCVCVGGCWYVCTYTPVRMYISCEWSSACIRMYTHTYSVRTYMHSSSQGLRTLELCVDNLQPDFLYEHIQPVRAELMQVRMHTHTYVHTRTGHTL